MVDLRLPTVMAATGFDPARFLETAAKGRVISAHPKKQIIFAQDAPADSVLYIRSGKVKLTALSVHGKEAVIALLSEDEFFGEGCLTGQIKRNATAVALTDCVIMRVSKTEILRVLRDEPTFSQMFMSYILTRSARMEADLLDQLLNPSELRLARALLLMAHFGAEGKSQPTIERLDQATLADMIGTTRSRVNFFMNKFRDLGFIDYDGATDGRLKIHGSLLSVVLNDQPNPIVVRHAMELAMNLIPLPSHDDGVRGRQKN